MFLTDFRLIILKTLYRIGRITFTKIDFTVDNVMMLNTSDITNYSLVKLLILLFILLSILPLILTLILPIYHAIYFIIDFMTDL
jgi:hypothetical protein